jgi:hypothetical protein
MRYVEHDWRTLIRLYDVLCLAAKYLGECTKAK